MKNRERNEPRFMSDWIRELNERSKDDRAVIVGSEVRQLCAEIDTLRSDLAKAREEVRDAHASISSTQMWMDMVEERVAAERARDEALAEVARLKRTVAHAHLRTHGHNPGACSGCESVERALGRTDGESK